MTSYKGIIRNMVDCHVTHEVEKSGIFAFVDSVELTTENKALNCPEYVAAFHTYGKDGIIRRDYEMHGYISEYGTVVSTLLTYERTHVIGGDIWSGHTVTRQYTVYAADIESFDYSK